MALIQEQQEKVTLDPKPGFVVKTKILESKDLSQISTKVFINICHDHQVPKPSIDFTPEVVFPLIIDNQWEIPLIVSQEKKTTDKKGFPSLVYDCCINTDCFNWCQISKALRLILIEWCIESVELLYQVVLEREYSIPKMLNKGELSHTIVGKDELETSGFQKKLQELKENEQLGLIQEMSLDDSKEDEADQELPDLLNISSQPSTKRKLIEEIEEPQMSSRIEEVKSKSSKIEEVDQGEEELLNYDVSFRKIEDPKYKLAIIFKCDQIPSGEYLELQFSQASSTLLLTNKLKGYKFNNNGNNLDPTKNILEIPLSQEIKLKPLKTFFVTTTNQLFIFM
ncbi:uncharacterized protein J8A68_002610 [[Candida] subhashii]|uniref:PIH1 N-terminal domain-containing protein n=1 Tax=[Candida] subhashii TaxID=561895 RepID=A0A8J5QG41_9ASCO|nr:uncharacterized protein J8A68_002610 [[Candida] subhashii]KAG7663861.1 hypothetical protein J8A68_002610 [[Candida] subhashii]